jgi:hypothetical protein
MGAWFEGKEYAAAFFKGGAASLGSIFDFQMLFSMGIQTKRIERPKKGKQ